MILKFIILILGLAFSFLGLPKHSIADSNLKSNVSLKSATNEATYLSCSAFLDPEHTLHIPAKRDPLRIAMYSKKLIVANDFLKKFSNKVFAAELLNQHTPEHLQIHLGRSQGLLFFLNQNENLSLEEKIKAQYPKGFVVKPAQAQNTYGLGIIRDLSDLKKLVDSKTIDLGSLSDEKFLIEELHSGTIFGSDLGDEVQTEFRIHTLGDRVVRGATLSRWHYWEAADHLVVIPLENSVEEFLQALPQWMTAQHAWSLDVTINRDGIWKLIEINTNKGLEGNWSGFLLNPTVLSAYFKHVMKHHDWTFNPTTLLLVKHDFANYQTYIRREFTETELETFRDPVILVEEVLTILNTLYQRSERSLLIDPGQPDLIDINIYIRKILKSLKKSKTIGDQYWLEAKSLSGAQ